MKSIPFDLVGFDLDGTLLDTHKDLGDAVNHALRTIDRDPVPADRVRGLVGGGARKMLARALALTGGEVKNEVFDRLFVQLLDHYEANISRHSALFPGGAAMLDELAFQGVHIGVVTNKLERFARKLLDALDLTPRFCTILGGDSLGPGKSKPAPDLLLEMISRCGGGPAAFVGDTSFDAEAAAAAGIPCVVVGFGYNDRPVDRFGADAVIHHFDELTGALRSLAR